MTLLERLRKAVAPRYTIDREIARGMGIVFVGEDARLAHRVACGVSPGVCLLDTDSGAAHTRGRSRNLRAALHELPASRGTAWLKSPRRSGRITLRPVELRYVSPDPLIFH